MTEFRGRAERSLVVRSHDRDTILFRVTARTHDFHSVAIDKSRAIDIARLVLEIAGADAEIVTDIPKVTMYDDQLGVYYFDDGDCLTTEGDADDLLDDAKLALGGARYLRSRPDPQVEKLATVLDRALADLPKPTPAQLAKALIKAGVRAP